MLDATQENAALEALLGPEGPVAHALSTQAQGYEPRPEQVEMAGAVQRALSSGRHLVVEAGTGVGKSFAYLVPLLRWAARTDATVAVATSTIALQEQLVRKDLPMLAESLPFDVSYALVKGRGNYLCLRRLGQALGDKASLFDEATDLEELEAIRDWSDTTRDGSLQDLAFRPRGGVWDLVRAEQGNCKGRACRWFSRCHYQRSRQEAHKVRCLVLNHHVLMADLALRRSGGSFLPKIDALVVDEAHDLEDTAAEHLGLRFTSIGTAVLLGRLWSDRRRRGLLGRSSTAERLRRQVDDTRKVARRFFASLATWAENASEGGTVALGDGFPVSDTLSPRLRQLADGLGHAASALGDEDLTLELSARARQLEAASDTLEGIVVPRDGEVRWVSQGGRGSLSLSSAPIAVAPLLGGVLWNKHRTVVLTSATLATGRPPSFDFLRERIGLEEADELSVGSPFDFSRQARVVIRSDMPDPVSASAAYEAALPEAVLEAVRRTDGGAFVLFTGYGAMRRTAQAVRDELEEDGLEVLVQGEDLERPALLERFRHGASVLFGVSSFWQGVDVPGDALRHVVIARLPFEVPTHPLQRARADRLEREGRSAFAELSLPVAALKLKQGFGRLIRSTSDTGMVTILDPRIRTRNYGRYLLASLPDCPIEDTGPGGGETA